MCAVLVAATSLTLDHVRQQFLSLIISHNRDWSVRGSGAGAVVQTYLCDNLLLENRLHWVDMGIKSARKKRGLDAAMHHCATHILARTVNYAAFGSLRTLQRLLVLNQIVIQFHKVFRRHSLSYGIYVPAHDVWDCQQKLSMDLGLYHADRSRMIGALEISAYSRVVFCSHVSEQNLFVQVSESI
jgi:hypothetical protein